MDNANKFTKTDNTDNNHTLVAVTDVDGWEMQGDVTDARGWTMYANGVAIGEVKNLIANTADKKVAYLEVELDESMNDYRDKDYCSRRDGGFQ